jgi:outer membrane lipoprotein-sorting protein
MVPPDDDISPSPEDAAQADDQPEDAAENEETQKKKLSRLAHEIVIRGKLYLGKEGRLAWHVASPIKYSCVIEKDTIKQWDEDSGEVTTVSAEDHPGLKVVFRYLRSWFSGELRMLTKEFKYKADVEKRQLEFTPLKDSGAAGFVKKISMQYREDLVYLDEIKVIEANGDKTTITYSDVKLNKVIAPELWNVIQK